MLTCNVRLIKRSAAVAFTLKVPPESLFTPQVTFAFRPSFLRAARTPQSGRTAASRTPVLQSRLSRGLRTTSARSGPHKGTGGRDGVARRGAACHPQARSGQERRGGEKELAHGVQVGIPHVLSSNAGRMKTRHRFVIWKWTLGVCVWGYSSRSRTAEPVSTQMRILHRYKTLLQMHGRDNDSASPLNESTQSL